jgi:hypothetical protein
MLLSYSSGQVVSQSRHQVSERIKHRYLLSGLNILTKCLYSEGKKNEKTNHGGQIEEHFGSL